MPKKKRSSALYQRGEYRLDWDRAADGTLRSPFLAVFWYDAARGGGRSASTGTTDVEEGKTWLDAFYLERTTGQAVCPTCLRAWDQHRGYLVTAAIADYLALTVPGKDSAGAIRARLDHVVAYLEAKKLLEVTCEDIDETWIERFRRWSAKQPVRSIKGRVLRVRALSTTEASVAQLSAAINDAKRRRNITVSAQFKSQPAKELNRSPQHRSTVDELVSMFRYCVEPDVAGELTQDSWGHRKAMPEEEVLVEIRRRERAALHRFLIISVSSLARPDAAHDVATDPLRRQWNSNARILALNPAGRRQTKKYRAIVPLAHQAARCLDEAHREWLMRKAEAESKKLPEPPSFFVGPKSVRKAWEGMCAELKLPGQGEAGFKLIRRSMAKLLRDRLPKADWTEVVMFLGHAQFDQTSDIYAPFDPAYLGAAKTEIELIIDEIASRVPGAFRRSFAGASGNVIPIMGGLNA